MEPISATVVVALLNASIKIGSFALTHFPKKSEEFEKISLLHLELESLLAIKSKEERDIQIRHLLARSLPLVHSTKTESVNAMLHADIAVIFGFLDETEKEQFHLNTSCDFVVKQMEQEKDTVKFQNLKEQRDMLYSLIRNRIARISY